MSGKRSIGGWEALRTLSLIRGLTHVVQVENVNAGASFWETLAAFNVERVADDYAMKCRAATGRAYRVQRLEGWDQ